MHKGKGFTLVELLIGISIVSITLAIAIPNLSNFIIQLRVDNQIQSLSRAIAVARNTAITTGFHVTICPLETELKCHDNWNIDLSVFIDENKNKILDRKSLDKIITIKDAVKSNDILYFVKGRKNLTFKPNGKLTGLSNGTFRYCPNNQVNYARGITVFRSGRHYLSNDYNGDGLEENRSKKPLSCS